MRDDRECCRRGTGKWASTGGKRADRRGARAGADKGWCLVGKRSGEEYARQWTQTVRSRRLVEGLVNGLKIKKTAHVDSAACVVKQAL